MASSESQKLAQKNYYEKNKQKISEKYKNYYQENKNVILNRTKSYYFANRDKFIQYKRDYYYNNVKRQFNISYEPKTLYFN